MRRERGKERAGCRHGGRAGRERGEGTSDAGRGERTGINRAPSRSMRHDGRNGGRARVCHGRGMRARREAPSPRRHLVIDPSHWHHPPRTTHGDARAARAQAHARARTSTHSSSVRRHCRPPTACTTEPFRSSAMAAAAAAAHHPGIREIAAGVPATPRSGVSHRRHRRRRHHIGSAAPAIGQRVRTTSPPSPPPPSPLPLSARRRPRYLVSRSTIVIHRTRRVQHVCRRLGERVGAAALAVSSRLSARRVRPAAARDLHDHDDDAARCRFVCLVEFHRQQRDSGLPRA